MLAVLLAAWAIGCQGIVPATEIEALHGLYTATAGQHWLWRNSSTRGAQWHFEGPNVNPCAEDGSPWQGLQCSDAPLWCQSPARSCYITAINIPLHNASGQLPSVLGGLKLLQLLNLRGNALTGPIPVEFGQLSSLVSLQLFDNLLTGAIPLELLGVTALTRLDLSQNALRGPIPSAIGQLSNLVELSLGENRFSSSLPVEIAVLTALEDLNLERNRLIGALPTGFGALTRLRIFNIQNNAFTGDVLPFLSNLTGLEVLDLTKNRFFGSIPSAIGQLAAGLVYFEMSSNLLTGPLPDELFALTNLLDLDLRINELTGSIPSAIGQLERILYVELSENFFTGMIPPSVSGLKSARSLFLDDSFLTGSIPSELYLMPSLRDLQLHENMLTGTIPAEISLLSSLFDLEFSQNFLTGSIPSTIADLKFLYSVALSNNYLTGSLSVPVRFTQFMDLSNNYLSGPLSDYFYPDTLVQFLYLQQNSFSGMVPSVLSGYRQLVHLFLFDNAFTGPVPSLDNCTFLQTLLLQNNQFTGQPDDFLSGATSLQVLDLSNNKFDKELPTLLWSLPDLSYVSIVETCSDGSIPPEICQSTSLKVLVLEGLRSGRDCKSEYWDPSGSLMGGAYYVQAEESTVPDCIWKMAQLVTLHLSGNTLQGPLPSDIRLPNVTSLSLTHNRFSGTIPEALMQHFAASRTTGQLDLSHNKFSGTCDKFTSIEKQSPFSPDRSLKLNVNRLSGDIPTEFELYSDIDVLTGNVFDCNTGRSELPDADPEKVNYVCGSNTFDLSIFSWLMAAAAIICALIIVIGVLYIVRDWHAVSAARRTLQGFRETVRSWRRCVEEPTPFPTDSLHFRKLIEVLKYLRLYSVYLAIFICGTYGVLYIVAKMAFGLGTHTYQYRWLISAAYLSGEAAAAWMLGFLVVILALVLWAQQLLRRCCHDIYDKSVSDSFSASQPPPNQYLSWKALCFVSSLIFSQILIILLVKISIIYNLAWSDISANEKLLLQLTLSFFDIAWNAVAIPQSSNLFPGLLRSDVRINLILLFLLFNSIVAPLLATAAVDRNCFANLYRSEDPVESSYTHEYCSRFTSIFQSAGEEAACSRFLYLSLSTSFDPPFTYSYACSSALITIFVPSLVFVYTFTSIGLPLVYGGLLWVKNPENVPLVGASLPRIFPFIFMPSDENTVFSPMISVKVLVARMLHNIAIMLTFGIASPMLAVVIAVDSVVRVSTWLLLFGRYLYECLLLKRENREHAALSSLVLKRLEESCHNVWSGPTRGTYVIISHCCLFFSMLAIDIAGDEIGWKRATLKLLVPAFCLPILFYGAYYGLTKLQVVDTASTSQEGDGLYEMSNIENGNGEVGVSGGENPVKSPLFDGGE